MTAIKILREEHRVILKALGVLEATADRLTSGERVPDALWAALLDWLRTFADIRHHAKEEELLFPAMLWAGVPGEGGPVAVMLEEHDRGRALVAGMADGEPSYRAKQAWEYAQLLRDHIMKEDLVLFPLADTVLDAGQVELLRRAFDRADHDDDGPTWSIDAAELVLDGLAAALEGPVAVH
jgi:hemerythrin-like domain-containing protein